MVIFRHKMELLEEAMKTCKEFNSFEELQQYIVDYMKPYLKLIPSDVVAGLTTGHDKRIGWEDTTYLCIKGYSEVSDKDGFEKYFGGKYESGCCVGMFATKYPQEQYIRYY